MKADAPPLFSAAVIEADTYEGIFVVLDKATFVPCNEPTSANTSP